MPLEPDVARNGNIFNIWTLDLTTGELKQYTDALGGNLSPVVLNEGTDKRIAFVSYYKGDYGIHTLDRKEPLHTAASADFGSPGPIIDFQAPLSHTLVAENNRKKKRFEKMFLEGRPPVNLGVTSNGDVFGGTAITFGDVLGDQQFNVIASSISQYRSLGVSYSNLSRRFQFALPGFSQTQFFYGALEGVFYDPSLAPLVSRDQAVATRTTQGGSAFAIYPFNRYRRLELSAGFYHLNEEYDEPGVQDYLNFYELQPQSVFRSGTLLPFGVAFVQETTVFREFGPLAGNTMRLAYDYAPKIGGTLSRQTFDVDARYYQRLATSGVLALRFRGFKSIGRLPGLHVLRRQLRDARLRLLAVHRPERGVRQRRTALPDHRSRADADRRDRRHPRRVLREHRRRLVQQRRVRVRHRSPRAAHAGDRLPERRQRTRRSSTSPPACRSRFTGRSRSFRDSA